MKSKIRNLKNHVVRHRAKYAAATAGTATAVVAVKLMLRAGEEWREFAEEHGVIDAWNDHLTEAVQ